jgi:hypothetical protein
LISLCLHCEERPAAGVPALCDRCRAVRGVPRLYRRRRGWTPAWEQNLLRLTRRARLQLPLFEPDEPR